VGTELDLSENKKKRIFSVSVWGGGGWGGGGGSDAPRCLEVRRKEATQRKTKAGRGLFQTITVAPGAGIALSSRRCQTLCTLSGDQGNVGRSGKKMKDVSSNGCDGRSLSKEKNWEQRQEEEYKNKPSVLGVAVP